MIEVLGVSKKYQDKNGDDIEILNQADLTVTSGEIIAIIGASGSGKSTLLHLIGGLDSPDSGIIKINGEDISGFNTEKAAYFRNHQIGFVFQFHHLLPEFTALENAALPAMIMGESKSKAQKKAEHMLDLVGLSHRLTHRPAELSGGEQQRVAIARALINSPAVILADEPTGNLDSKNSSIILQLFLEIQNQTKTTMVLVTHDPSIAEKTNRVVELKSGKLHTLQTGVAKNQPVTSYLDF